MDFSSCVMCLLTSDFDRFRLRAAAEKLLCSTTRANIAIRWRSSIAAWLASWESQAVLLKKRFASNIAQGRAHAWRY